MKTYAQILRYTSQCSFPDEDWQKVKDFCLAIPNGGNIRKASNPIFDSSYDLFIDWFENGFGSGDLVSYGNTMGIVGDSFPEKVYLVAYLDYEKRLVINNMDILEPHRLKCLDSEKSEEWKSIFYGSGFDYNVRESQVIKIKEPQKDLLYTLSEGPGNNLRMGRYLETKEDQYHFSAYLENGKIFLDHWININFTPLKKSTEKEISRFNNIIQRSGLIFDERQDKYIKKISEQERNNYWYLNDRFEVVMDKDDGSIRHRKRKEVGNYFFDQLNAIRFMTAVQKLRGED